ncbi:protein spaetzle 5 isoform X2 [Prorops nasuta]|uniref:protein spaetzle 5 isoform X2 n=1 Tax=Prorops nasuta TaxID=863751 RepID=UPI0034CEA83A
MGCRKSARGEMAEGRAIVVTNLLHSDRYPEENLLACCFFAEMILDPSWSLLLVLFTSCWAEPCTKYGCPGRPHYESFVPAPPGHTPRCAKPGDTFCETIDHYPKQLIKFLVDKCSLDFSSILRDESSEDFQIYRPHPGEHAAGDYEPLQPPRAHSPILPPYIPFRYPASTGPPALAYGPASNDTQWQGYVYSTPQRPQKTAATSETIANPPKFNPSFRPHPAIYQPTQHVDPFKERQNRWTNRYTSTPAPRTTFWENPFLQFRNSQERRRAKRQTDLDFIDICPTSPQYITPRAALNNQGNWMTTDCNGLCSLPEGYTSKCQQQYVQKRLVALEGSGDRLYTDVFWFPHGCSCQVTLTG